MLSTLLLPLPLLLLNFFSFGHCQVDPNFCRETRDTSTLPELPAQRFWANMASSQGNKLVSDVSIFYDAALNKMAVDQQSVSGDRRLRFVQDFANWQILANNMKDADSIDGCRVTNASRDVMHAMTFVTAFGEKMLLPSRLFFSGAGMRIKADGTESVSGVTTNKFVSCYYWNSMQATTEMTWWFSADAPSVPVAIAVRGKPKNAAQFSMYFSVNPLRELTGSFQISRNPFMAPAGVYCSGLAVTKKAIGTYQRFSLGVERNFPNLDSEAALFFFNEAYDLAANLTSLDGDVWANPEGHRLYGQGPLSMTHDFARGISYIRNKRYKNCTFAKIAPKSWDVGVNANRLRLKRPEEFYYPSIDKLQYKGSGTFRNYTVDAYSGFDPKGVRLPDGTTFPLSLEYYMTNRSEFGPQGTPFVRSVPLYLLYKSTYKQATSVTRVFNFDTGVPDAFHFDISDCFTMFDKTHFELLLPLDSLEDWEIDYIQQNLDMFLYSMKNSLATALNISPLRVLQPEITVNIANTILVELTLANKAEVQGYTPEQPEATLQAAADALTSKADGRQLFVELLEGDVIVAVPVAAAINLDSRGEKKSGGGVSAGAVVGISIATLLAGALLAIGALLLVAKLRNQPLLGSDPFGMQKMEGSSS